MSSVLPTIDMDLALIELILGYETQYPWRVLNALRRLGYAECHYEGAGHWVATKKGHALANAPGGLFETHPGMCPKEGEDG